MRKRLFEILEIGTEEDRLSRFYDLFMILVIVISIIPLAIKDHYRWMDIVDAITVTIFIIDYLSRWFTADFKYHGPNGFLRYPFSPMAIIDLVSILPSITVISSGWRLFKLLRLFKSFRVFRVFKIFRYSKSIILIINVFRKSKDTLMTIAWIALGYVIISALVVFNVEPDTFDTFFEALYWAMVSLTTVGYGDIYPVTVAGKIITMISSLFGIAIVALPAGTITAGMMDEIERMKNDDRTR